MNKKPLIVDSFVPGKKMMICPYQKYGICDHQFPAGDGAFLICTYEHCEESGECNISKKIINLQMKEILIFYDTSQLFVAKEIGNGTLYLCLLYHTNDDGTSLHIAVDISNEKLDEVVSGHIDLRDVFTNPERFWFDVTDNGDTMVATIRTEQPTEDMLPDKGYYLENESTRH